MSIPVDITPPTPEHLAPTVDSADFSRPVSSLSSVSKKDPSFPIEVDDLVDDEEEKFTWTKAIFRGKQIILPDLSAIATRRSVFDDPNLAPHY